MSVPFILIRHISPLALLKMVGVLQEGKGGEARWKREGGGGEKGDTLKDIDQPWGPKAPCLKGILRSLGETQLGGRRCILWKGEGGAAQTSLA